MMKVNNMPANAKTYVVARRDDNWNLWYWDSYEDRDKANEMAIMVSGVVVTKE